MIPATTTPVRQFTASQGYRATLELVPPVAEEFSVYGDSDTVERARAWALRHHYLLARGVARCAHGLYMLPMCPGSACRTLGQLDHPNLWVPASRDDGQPFLLAHPYSSEIEDEARTYAAAHGLKIRTYPGLGDNWYGGGTLPIRMEVPDDWPLWPIEGAAVEVLHTQPIAWPEEF